MGHVSNRLFPIFHNGNKSCFQVAETHLPDLQFKTQGIGNFPGTVNQRVIIFLLDKIDEALVVRKQEILQLGMFVYLETLYNEFLPGTDKKIGKNKRADFLFERVGEFVTAKHLIAVWTQWPHGAVFPENIIKVESAAVTVYYDCTAVFPPSFFQPFLYSRTYLVRLQVQLGVNSFKLGIPTMLFDDRLNFSPQRGTGNE